MPELPEVENVKLGLAKFIESRPQIKGIHFFRKDIRAPMPIKKLKALEGQYIEKISRRAKYLLFHTSKGNILSHLGMTGSWRLILSNHPLEKEKHDHVAIEFADKAQLVFNDPRRFGLLDFIAADGAVKQFLKMGPEPLSTEFNQHYLLEKIKKHQQAIKTFIMDQKVVVGVGNIYASEALFYAGVKPHTQAKRLKLHQVSQLVGAIKEVLHKAIAAGGSSIRDYRNIEGESGNFQNAHQVYDRDGDPCLVCESVIRKQVLGGRSTFWCPTCQK